MPRWLRLLFNALIPITWYQFFFYYLINIIIYFYKNTNPSMYDSIIIMLLNILFIGSVIIFIINGFKTIINENKLSNYNYLIMGVGSWIILAMRNINLDIEQALPLKTYYEYFHQQFIAIVLMISVWLGSYIFPYPYKNKNDKAANGK